MPCYVSAFLMIPIQLMSVPHTMVRALQAHSPWVMPWWCVETRGEMRGGWCHRDTSVQAGAPGHQPSPALQPRS